MLSVYFELHNFQSKSFKLLIDELQLRFIKCYNIIKDYWIEISEQKVNVILFHAIECALNPLMFHFSSFFYT